MNSRLQIPGSEAEFSTIWAEVTTAVDPSLRLPDWPFVQAKGHVVIGQYERLLGADFVPVLETLTSAHGDDYISFITINPDPEYYVTNYGHFPAFRIAHDALAVEYWPALTYEPGGDPTGALAYTANVVGMVGSTRAWSIWGQRDWDLVLVHTQTIEGAWLHTEVPFVNATDALANFTAPTRWMAPLTDSQASAFLKNLRDRGALV
jgi:hypothetical protein